MPDPEQPEGGFHDFSDRELPMQQRFAALRTRVVGPIVEPLAKMGVRADHFTLLGVALLIPFGYFFISNPVLAFWILFAYVVCDGIDGPYARVTKTANLGGAFADLVADQLGMVVVTLLAIHHGLVHPTLAAGYAIIYVVMIAFVVAQNSFKIGTPTVLRSKYVLYLTYGAWAFTGWNGLNWMMAFFVVTMVISSVSSFVRLKRHLSKLES